jgi:hypothetical protein
MTPMLARPATVAQATFEPVEDAEEEDEDELPALSPGFLSDFLSPVPDLSPDDEEDDESELTVLSVFLPSEPFDEAAAGSALFWLVRLSVR